MAFLTTFNGLIDDITTGGTQKALSAEQGKNLQLGKQDKLPVFDYRGSWDGNLTELYAYLQTLGNLRSANFQYKTLTSANLSSVDLTSANLYYAVLTSANLYYANLTSANLYYANLTSANLSSVKFIFANLSSANLSSVILISANFTNAIGLAADINIALSSVNKNPYGNGNSWTLTWTDGLVYTYNPATGLFTHA